MAIELGDWVVVCFGDRLLRDRSRLGGGAVTSPDDVEGSRGIPERWQPSQSSAAAASESVLDAVCQ